MIPVHLFAEILTYGWLTTAGGLLMLGGLGLFATLLYAALRDTRSAYIEQGERFSRCRLTGRELVGRLLAHVGLSSDAVEEGAKIDHYDQLRRRVKLRTESSRSSSVAALAIAAHEVGHAEQFAKGYWAARASRYLLVLFVFGAAVLFVYPFAVTIAGAGEVNLASLVASGALVAVLRMPITISLERDANRRGERLLNETGLAHETEHEGIARLWRAGIRVHVLCSMALVLLIGGGAAIMWLVEDRLGTPALADVQVGVGSELEPGEPLPQMQTIADGEGYVYPLAFVVAVATVWWAFSGKKREAPSLQGNGQ
jgi:Zn-dependent membrane protease YugP